MSATPPDVVVHPPQKRKDHFLSSLSDPQKRKIRCKISGAAWIQLHPVEGDGHVLRLYLPEHCEAKQQLASIDEQVMAQTAEHNAQWFPNALSEEKLRAYFRPSVQRHPHSTLGIYVSSWKDPLIYVNGAVVDSVQELQSVPKNARVRVEIEPLGVCFYRQKFGVRWLLRKAWIHTHPIEEADGCVDGWEERAAVEEAWSQELLEYHQIVEKERATLAAKMEALEGRYQSLRGMFRHAKEAQDPQVWNEQLENLSKALAKYRAGAVSSHE